MSVDPDKTSRIELVDGSAAVLRALRPSDKAGLVEGFERLSPQTRYKRFFSYKTELMRPEDR